MDYWCSLFVSGLSTLVTIEDLFLWIFLLYLIVGSVGFGLWFEDTSHGYASPLALVFVAVHMPCSIQVAFGFDFLSRLDSGGYLFYISWNLGLVASWYLWCDVCSTCVLGICVGCIIAKTNILVL
jgi:hypothetical protein